MRLGKSRHALQLLTITLGLSLVSAVCFSPRAHALDRRLKLMFKTAAYGAGAGLVVGAGTAALGIGNARNALMGASAGMYAGILLAGYLVATQDSYEQKLKRFNNPYSPRRPVGPDDWEEENNDDDVLREHVPSINDEDRYYPDMGSSGTMNTLAPREVAIWTPVLSVSF